MMERDILSVLDWDILLITTYDTVKTFSDQIYSSLDLIDPATLNK